MEEEVPLWRRKDYRAVQPPARQSSAVPRSTQRKNEASTPVFSGAFDFKRPAIIPKYEHPEKKHWLALLERYQEDPDPAKESFLKNTPVPEIIALWNLLLEAKSILSIRYALEMLERALGIEKQDGGLTRFDRWHRLPWAPKNAEVADQYQQFISRLPANVPEADIPDMMCRVFEYLSDNLHFVSVISAIFMYAEDLVYMPGTLDRVSTVLEERKKFEDLIGAVRQYEETRIDKLHDEKRAKGGEVIKQIRLVDLSKISS